MSRSVLTAATVVALLAVGVGGWLWFSARAAAGVTVAWSPQSPHCTGTEVHRPASGAVIEAVKGMRCVITVTISNNGPLDVQLDTATAQFLGPDTGTVVTAGNADGASPDGRLDAQYQLDRSLGPGQIHRFDVLIRFHPSGCNDGGRFWVHGWPRVGLTVLGLSHERSADETFSFHRAGPTPGCRDLDAPGFS